MRAFLGFSLVTFVLLAGMVEVLLGLLSFVVICVLVFALLWGVFTAFVCLLLRVVNLGLVPCTYLHVYVVVCVFTFLWPFGKPGTYVLLFCCRGLIVGGIC